jgi:tetratricopeptide (TPR) repeat protein
MGRNGRLRTEVSLSYRLLLGLALAFAPAAFAEPPQTPTPEQAEALFQAEDWAEAAAAFGALVAADPNDGGSWFKLGFALYKSGEIAESAQAWQRALELGFFPMISAYNVAAAKALLGDPEGAFALLDKAIAAGFNDPEILRTDPDFLALRGDPRFAALIEQAEHNARPCMYDAKYRAFDFWIGEWVVRDEKGGKVASDRVKQAESGCAIVGLWTDQFGHTGTSLTWFDPRTQKWRQTRVSATGTFIDSSGNLDRRGAMVMDGDLVTTSGHTGKVKTSWEPRADGTVRLLVQQSDDGGKTWITAVDATYERRDLYGGD